MDGHTHRTWKFHSPCQPGRNPCPYPIAFFAHKTAALTSLESVVQIHMKHSFSLNQTDYFIEVNLSLPSSQGETSFATQITFKHTQVSFFEKKNIYCLIPWDYNGGSIYSEQACNSREATEHSSLIGREVPHFSITASTLHVRMGCQVFNSTPQSI